MAIFANDGRVAEFASGAAGPGVNGTPRETAQNVNPQQAVNPQTQQAQQDKLAKEAAFREIDRLSQELAKPGLSAADRENIQAFITLLADPNVPVSELDSVRKQSRILTDTISTNIAAQQQSAAPPPVLAGDPLAGGKIASNPLGQPGTTRDSLSIGGSGSAQDLQAQAAAAAKAAANARRATAKRRAAETQARLVQQAKDIRTQEGLDFVLTKNTTTSEQLSKLINDARAVKTQKATTAAAAADERARRDNALKDILGLRQAGLSFKIPNLSNAADAEAFLAEISARPSNTQVRDVRQQANRLLGGVEGGLNTQDQALFDRIAAADSVLSAQDIQDFNARTGNAETLSNQVTADRLRLAGELANLTGFEIDPTQVTTAELNQALAALKTRQAAQPGVAPDAQVGGTNDSGGTLGQAPFPVVPPSPKPAPAPQGAPVGAQRPEIGAGLSAIGTPEPFPALGDIPGINIKPPTPSLTIGALGSGQGGLALGGIGSTVRGPANNGGDSRGGPSFDQGSIGGASTGGPAGGGIGSSTQAAVDALNKAGATLPGSLTRGPPTVSGDTQVQRFADAKEKKENPGFLRGLLGDGLIGSAISGDLTEAQVQQAVPGLIGGLIAPGIGFLGRLAGNANNRFLDKQQADLGADGGTIDQIAAIRQNFDPFSGLDPVTGGISSRSFGGGDTNEGTNDVSIFKKSKPSTTTIIQQPLAAASRSPEELQLIRGQIALQQEQLSAFRSQQDFQRSQFDAAQPLIAQQSELLKSIIAQQNQSLQSQQPLLQAQVSLLQQQAARQSEEFALTRGLFAQQSQAFQQQLSQSQDLQPFIQEQFAVANQLQQAQLEAIKNAGKATPEQLALIKEATSAALAGGEININRFQNEATDQLRGQLAPSLGLRPTDSPIIDRGNEVAEEAVRQQGSLVAALAEAEAKASLDFPLAQQQLIGAQSAAQQQLALAQAEFQAGLQNQAFQNRLNVSNSASSFLQGVRGAGAATTSLTGDFLSQLNNSAFGGAGVGQNFINNVTQGGLGLAGFNPGIGSFLSALNQGRGTQQTTTTSGGGGFGLSGFSSLLGGAGSLFSGLGALRGI